MTIGLSTGMRNDRLQLILDAIDSVGSGGHLLLFNGTKPAVGSFVDEYDEYDAYDLLANFTLPYPCGTISNGILTFGAISDAIGLETGSATWARIINASGVFVMDLTVGVLSSFDVVMDSVVVDYMGPVSCTIATITEGNA